MILMAIVTMTLKQGCPDQFNTKLGILVFFRNLKKPEKLEF